MDKSIYMAVVVVVLLLIVVVALVVTGLAQGAVTPLGEQLKNLIGWQ